MDQLCKAYKTDILSMRVYGRLVVFLNSFDLIKDSFQKRTDLVDRIVGAFFQILYDDFGGENV